MWNNKERYIEQCYALHDLGHEYEHCVDAMPIEVLSQRQFPSWHACPIAYLFAPQYAHYRLHIAGKYRLIPWWEPKTCDIVKTEQTHTKCLARANVTDLPWLINGIRLWICDTAAVSREMPTQVAIWLPVNETMRNVVGSI